MANAIDRIKLELDGIRWNEVTLSEYKGGRRVETTYSNIDKKTIMKLLNSSKCPTVGDFEGWVRDADAARKKSESSPTIASADSGCGWYEA